MPQGLEIPMSEITDLMVLKHAESLENLTELDISYCLRLTSNGIETFGKQCKSLVCMKRNMPPPDWGSIKTDDSEVVGIANTMSGLRGLKLGYGCFGDSGLNVILCNCKELNHLDIRGCLRVELIGDLEEKCERLVHFQKNPWIDDEYDKVEGSSEDGSNHDSEESSSIDHNEQT